MQNTRRMLLKAAAVTPLAAVCRSAFAQTYPTRPIRVIVPAGAGTGIDAVARFFTEPLTTLLGKPFVIENRPGAGGLLGYREASTSAPDGYTLILTGVPLYLLPLLNKGVPTFDPKNHFVPVARITYVPNAIVVAADSPYKTLGDLLTAMKNKPNEITFSSQGVGSTANFCGVAINDASGTTARHIPYKETSMAITDVVAGRIDFTCQSSPATLPLIKGGRLRALAVTSNDRWKSLPDVATADQDLPSFKYGSQLDFMAPAGTPEHVLKLLSDSFRAVTQTPQYAEFCERQAIEQEFMDYKALMPEVDREIARWQKMVDIAKI